MTTNNPEQTDLFLFANNIDGIKKDLQIELFLFNKNFTPYATLLNDSVQDQLIEAFVYELINEVNLGAGTGLAVHDIDYQKETTGDVVIRTELSKVIRAETLVHIIETSRDDILYFSEEEHDFKRMKGMVARVTSKTDPSILFHVVKLVEQSKAVTKSGIAWQFNGSIVEEMDYQVVFKPAIDNQTLIVGNDIFAFNLKKLEKTFNYDYVKFKQADEKAARFLKRFKIAVPSDIGGGIENILRETPSILNKFLKTDIDLIEQKQIFEIADAMQLELMSDDAGAVIIMDKVDLNVLLDIINDNYYQSPTGHHYVAKSKKAIEVAES